MGYQFDGSLLTSFNILQSNNFDEVISTTFEFVHTKSEISTEPYNFKEVLSQKMSIEDLFKAINKKIKRGNK